jgi:sugar phosphate isomerase/epimerase
MEIAMEQTRRDMIKSVGCVLAAPGVLTAHAPAKRYPIGFSTLGCPKWGWKTILNHAADWGFAAIELRGLQGEMDLTKCPEFSPGRIAESLGDLAALNLRISDLGSSANLHVPDASGHQAQLDEAKRFIDLAHRLKTPCVRVFGDKWVPGEPHEVTIDRVAASLRELGAYASSGGVTVILETHGDFPHSAIVLEMMKKAGMPDVGVLWDTHHTWVDGREEPAETFKVLGPYVRHVHLKDSVPAGTDVRYVLTGTGKVPMREIVGVLAKGGYRGIYSFEWEKAWIPEIEEPEVAFPQFAKVMSGYLHELGVAPVY